jgi:hypothetical protein
VPGHPQTGLSPDPPGRPTTAGANGGVLQVPSDSADLYEVTNPRQPNPGLAGERIKKG